MEQHDWDETRKYAFKVHIVGNSEFAKILVMICVAGKYFSKDREIENSNTNKGK